MKCKGQVKGQQRNQNAPKAREEIKKQDCVNHMQKNQNARKALNAIHIVVDANQLAKNQNAQRGREEIKERVNVNPTENRDLCFYLFAIINKTHGNKLK